MGPKLGDPGPPWTDTKSDPFTSHIHGNCEILTAELVEKLFVSIQFPKLLGVSPYRYGLTKKIRAVGDLGKHML